MLQALNLSMNKSTTNLSRVELRDSDKGEILESFILNSDGTPYDLSGKSLVFNENKDGDKFVSDSNVTIVDAKIGHITYQLHDQVHSAPGTAWFDIIQNGTKIDSTTDFYIEVRDGLKCTVYNTTYISDLEKLKRQMESLIQQADGELKAELQRAEQQLNQELQNFRNQYNSLSADFQNQFKTAQNARQQDYNNQKNAINNDWNENKGKIWGQWNSDKASIDKQAQDTVQAIKDNAKQVLDKDQADWNAKQNQWDSTFSAIVKEWQVKTNSLNSTVQDLTTKFGNIINELSDLMNKKLPDMSAQTDAVNKKIDQLKASLSDVDWTEFARRTDNSGGVNLLAHTEDLNGFNNGNNSGQFIDFSIEAKKSHINETGGNEIKTKVAHVHANQMKYAPVYFRQNVYLPKGTYTLSFLARSFHPGQPRQIGLYSEECADHGWSPWGVSDKINNDWEKHSITFTLSKDTYLTNLRLHQNTTETVPGGSLYFANFKLEAGSIATDWCQSYLDFDRLDGRHDPIDAPNFNNLTSTGIYMITQPDHGQNYPTGDGGTLKVENGYDSRIEQTFYAEDVSGSVYRRQLVDKTWRDWKKVASIDDVNTSLPLAGGNMTKGSWITWSGSSANSAKDGQLGGIQWTGATDNIKVFGDNNGADNLDLAIQLGDDNSNHISIRDKDGTERATITADGQFTGHVDWNNINKKPNVATKDDLTVVVVKDFDVATKQYGAKTHERLGYQWLVDQDALLPFAEDINSIKGQGSYRHTEAVDLNTFTGRSNQVSTYILTNMNNKNYPVSAVNPNLNDPRGTLIVFNFDGNAKTQLWIPVGTSGGGMGFAWRYWKGNNPPAWNIFYDAITSVRSSVEALRSDMTAQNMAQNKVNKRVDYENPSGTISNDTVDFNNYRETGILKVVNCLIQNGPYKSEYRHTLFLKITNLDGQTQYQTVYEGDNLYGRKLYNGSGQWHKYTNTPI